MFWVMTSTTRLSLSATAGEMVKLSVRIAINSYASTYPQLVYQVESCILGLNCLWSRAFHQQSGALKNLG